VLGCLYAGVGSDRDVAATYEGHQQVYRDATVRGFRAHLIDRRP
jgi:hypothetical protein